MPKILILQAEPTFVNPFIDILEIDGINCNDIVYCGDISDVLQTLATKSNEIACISMGLSFADRLNILKADNPIIGLNALRQIREKYPKVPIAIYTMIRDSEGAIKEYLAKYNATYVSKTYPESVEKLITFFKKHYHLPDKQDNLT